MKLYFMGVEDYFPLAQSLGGFLNTEVSIIDEGEAYNFSFDKDDIIYPNYFIEGELVKLFDDCIVVAPHTNISKKWDNKIYQYENLDVPKPDFTVHENLFNLISHLIRNKNQTFVITTEYGNEGSASMLFDKNHVDVYNRYINMKEHKFRSSIYFSESIGVAVNMVLFKNDIFLAPITQQKLNGLKYIGGFYPPRINSNIKDKIIDYAQKVGRILIADGYKGLCGIDFIVNDDSVLLAEINPRKTGTAVAVSKMLSYSLSVLEYLAVTNEEKPSVKQDTFEWEI